MKPLLPSQDKKQSKINLLENECLNTDPLAVAEKFNEYFSNVASSSSDYLQNENF